MIRVVRRPAVSGRIVTLATMSSEAFGELDSPTLGLDGDAESCAPAWAQLVTLLWALSRARTGRVETARFRNVRSELQDCFAEYRDPNNSERAADVAATWLSMGRSQWWSTDLRPDSGATPMDVEGYNSTGGLSPAALVVARDDEACGAAVLEIVRRLPYSTGLEQLLGVFLFDEFVEFSTAAAESSPSGIAQWYGLLDAERVKGSHELADAAGEGEWDRVLELLDEARTGGLDLVNSWRPGGVSWSTPLHHAARQGAPVEVIEALVDRGAWLGLPDADGLLALDHALRGGHSELFEAVSPPDVSELERALDRALELQAKRAIELICTESRLLRVPRFRPPAMTVLRECGGVLAFAVDGEDLVLHFWVEDEELFVAYWWGTRGHGGSVHVFGPEGERRDAPWNGTFHGTGSPQPESGDEEDEPPADDPGDEPDPVHPLESPTYSGQRLLVGTSRRFGRFYLLGPRARRDEIMRRPEADSRTIGIFVRRTHSSCSWAVSGRSWHHDLHAFDELPEPDQWTDLILFCALFKRNALSDRLTAMADFWARTGRDPLSTPEFVTAMRKGLEERDVRAIEDRWRPFVRSMRTHGLAPSGTFGRPDCDEPDEDDAVIAESAIASASAVSKKGRDKEFATGLPMSLRTAACDAQARWNGRSMVVLAGSRASLSAQRGFAGGYAVLRRQLEDSGKLARRGGHLVFTENHRFDAPSAAASVICGSSQNGRDIWRDPSGRNINTIEGGVKYVRAR